MNYHEDGDAPYCLKDFSKIDIVIAPLMERINCLLLYYKNEDLHWNFDIISRYMDAMERRPAYRATQSDIHTHAYNLPAYIGRCYFPFGKTSTRMSEAVDTGTFNPNDFFDVFEETIPNKDQPLEPQLSR
jgi:glutathione S-transferase